MEITKKFGWTATGIIIVLAVLGAMATMEGDKRPEEKNPLAQPESRVQPPPSVDLAGESAGSKDETLSSIEPPKPSTRTFTPGPSRASGFYSSEQDEKLEMTSSEKRQE